MQVPRWIGLRLPLVLLVATSSAASGREARPERIVPGSRFARLQASETCRARFPVAAGFGDELCFGRDAWARWLRAGEARPDLGCAEWSGHWKASSPPVNVPTRFGDDPESASAAHRKRVRWRFVVSGWQAAPGDCAPAWRAPVDAFERFRLELSDRLASGDRWGVVRALLLHEAAGPRIGGLLRLLGWIHLLTATGIHLYALAGLASQLALRTGAGLGLSARATLRLARGFAGAAWLAAWLLAGLRPGMLRPLIVVALRALARATGVRWRRWAPLALALAVDGALALIHRDWAPGRLHYALAVGGGLMASEGARGTPGWKAHLLLAIGSWAPVALLDAASDGLVSPLTPLLSVLSIPVFAGGVFPAGLAVGLAQAVGAEGSATRLASLLGESVSWALEGADRGLLARGLPSLWIVSPAALAVGVILGGVCRRRRAVAAGVAALLAARVSWSVVTPARDRSVDEVARPPAIVEQLDVGQGDSALVRPFGGPAGLIDAGSRGALGAEGWLRLLAARGITRLGWVALTHLDEDHSGGVRILARLLSIGCVVTSEAEWDSERGIELARELESLGVRTARWGDPCFPYDAWEPPERLRLESRTGLAAQGNSNMSAVLIPLLGGGSYLSMGDADRELERRIAPWAARLADRPLHLKVSHHGSRFSSDPAMIRLLRPVEAWVSSGVGNTYGHPSPVTLAEWARAGIPVRRTDQEGVIRAGGARRPR